MKATTMNETNGAATATTTDDDASPAPAARACDVVGKLSIVVVDDHYLVRLGVQNIVELQCGFEVVGSAANGEDAIAVVAKLQPKVVLMDVHMPRLNGIDATRAIKAQWPHVFVIALTMYIDDATREAMFAAGASGFIDKAALGVEICQTISEVAVDGNRSTAS